MDRPGDGAAYFPRSLGPSQSASSPVRGTAVFTANVYLLLLPQSKTCPLLFVSKAWLPPTADHSVGLNGRPPQLRPCCPESRALGPCSLSQPDQPLGRAGSPCQHFGAVAVVR